MKKITYVFILVGITLISACGNIDETKEHNVPGDTLYIKIDDYKVSPNNENFFNENPAENMVRLHCKSSFPEGTCVIVNKGARLNTVAEDEIKKASIHDTLVLKKSEFEIFFPPAFTTGGYISFEIDSAMQSNDIKKKLTDRIEKNINKIYFIEYSIDYKKKKNDNHIDVPEFPIQLIIKKTD